MKDYIATFHTHFAALKSQRSLTAAGFVARMMPVPRQLSSSCGTCVRYTANDPNLSLLHRDFEQVVQEHEGGYLVLKENL